MQFLYTIRGVRKYKISFDNYLFNFLNKKKFKNKVIIFGWPIITHTAKKPKFTFGKQIRMISTIHFSRSGIYHPVLIKLLTDEAELVVGDNVGMNGAAISVMQKVTIGDNTMVGANVFITDTDFHPVDPKNRRYSKENVGTRPVNIGSNVFIGRNSMIMRGYDW